MKDFRKQFKNYYQPVKVEDVATFLEINTFQCNLGRFTPEFCYILRNREPEVIDESGIKVEVDKRFAECRNCQVWFKLSEEVFEKRRKYVELYTNKKQEDNDYGLCSVCGKYKKIKYKTKQMCSNCYNKKYEKFIKCKICKKLRKKYVDNLCCNCYKKLKKKSKI